MSGHRLPTAVILTALEVEYAAIVDHLDQPLEEIERDGTVYERAQFSDSHRSWQVIIAQTGPGNVSAALHAHRATTAFQPDAVLFVGVAGGIHGVRGGDVVAAEVVYGYEEGKCGVRSTPRIKTTAASYALVQRARAVARRGTWIERLRLAYAVPPKAFVAPIASGEKIVAAHRGTAYALLRKNCGDALAVEKEGHGFLAAMHINSATPAMIVRGISDLLSDKSAANDSICQPLAARHAAAFAFELLAGLEIHARGPTSAVTPRQASFGSSGGGCATTPRVPITLHGKSLPMH